MIFTLSLPRSGHSLLALDIRGKVGSRNGGLEAWHPRSFIQHSVPHFPSEHSYTVSLLFPYAGRYQAAGSLVALGPLSPILGDDTAGLESDGGHIFPA
ncbi:hypothetical protein VUR80DRAFT_9601 [Thermomyces stellatus]